MIYMKRLFLPLIITAGLMATFESYAQAPAGAPAGSTALCKDGTYYSGEAKRGACGGHKGIKTWYGPAAAGAAPAAGASPAAAKDQPAKATAKEQVKDQAANAPAKEQTPPAPSKKTAQAAAPGGGPGQVWANASTKVYHCQGDRWYGKTKEGEYMSEADAKGKGFHPDHGKACK
jgi:Protein of unknown function (DUF3761)